MNRGSGRQTIFHDAEYYSAFLNTEDDILATQRGRQRRNLPRKVTMYLCQQACDMPLAEIANLFGINHKGGVSNALTEVRQLLLENEGFRKKVRCTIEMIQ